jgi:hypothetical protein
VLDSLLGLDLKGACSHHAPHVKFVGQRSMRVFPTPSSAPRQTREAPPSVLPARGRGLDAALRKGSPTCPPTLEKPLRNDYGHAPAVWLGASGNVPEVSEKLPSGPFLPRARGGSSSETHGAGAAFGGVADAANVVLKSQCHAGTRTSTGRTDTRRRSSSLSSWKERAHWSVRASTSASA